MRRRERTLPCMWPPRPAAEESVPPYVELARSGELERRAAEAHELLGERCVVCPRGCKVDRRADVKGLCAIGRYAVVASHPALRRGELPSRPARLRNDLLQRLQPPLRVLPRARYSRGNGDRAQTHRRDLRRGARRDLERRGARTPAGGRERLHGHG